LNEYHAHAAEDNRSVCYDVADMAVVDCPYFPCTSASQFEDYLKNQIYLSPLVESRTPMPKRLTGFFCLLFVLTLSTVLSADLLVHYKFDETEGSFAADASGNGYDGTVEEANWTTGHMDGALEFTGTGFVTLPANA
jgi:hypothetical protein